jgi:hypothetical protein
MPSQFLPNTLYLTLSYLETDSRGKHNYVSRISPFEHELSPVPKFLTAMISS